MITVLSVAGSSNLSILVSLSSIKLLLERSSYVHSEVMELIHVLVHEVDLESDGCRILV